MNRKTQRVLCPTSQLRQWYLRVLDVVYHWPRVAVLFLAPEPAWPGSTRLVCHHASLARMSDIGEHPTPRFLFGVCLTVF